MAGADGSLEGYRVPAGVEEPGAPKGSAAGVHAPARPVVVDGYVRSVRRGAHLPRVTEWRADPRCHRRRWPTPGAGVGGGGDDFAPLTTLSCSGSLLAKTTDL